MGTRAADYTEYIDITTSTVRRKRTGMLLRDSEDIFIVDPNISIPKNKQTNFLSKIQNDLTINSEKPYYFAKTSLQTNKQKYNSNQEAMADYRENGLSEYGESFEEFLQRMFCP